VSLLGVGRLRDWAMLMLVSDVNDGDEQQLSAVVTRARMCRNLAERMNMAPETAFTAGLVSAVAELLGQPPAEVAPRLSLNGELTEALVVGAGPLGELLALVSAYEMSDLPALIAAPVPAEDTTRSYLEAVAWSARMLEQADTDDSD
jgi:EAL and modified HD-GYP domain-containing signal transduction protein